MDDSLPREVLPILRTGFDEGVARYGDLGFPLEAFTRDVVMLIISARAALGLDAPPKVFLAAARKRALADLYLARACEAGHEPAWQALVDSFETRLVALARKEGGRRGNPEQEVSALFADLALPPSRAKGRTRIGTFAGMGALWAWLATQLVRRLWKVERQRTREGGGLPDAGVDAEPMPPVWADEIARETAQSLDAALDVAWRNLAREERLCLVLKHRHAMPQRRIAALFGVGEYQISRHVTRALVKLRGAVERGVPSPDPDDQTTWDHLKSKLADKLARFEALEAPLFGSTAGEAERND